MTSESEFFLKPQKAIHAHYEALRAFYVNQDTAEQVAEKFGYRVSTVYALTRDFKNLLRSRKEPTYHFFQRPQSGRNRKSESSELEKLIVDLRKQYLSVSEIKGILDSLNTAILILKPQGKKIQIERSKLETCSRLTFANKVKIYKI